MKSSAHRLTRLGLGTAQFGLDYGISNTGGQVGLEEAVRIAETASANGLKTIDTAHAYGSSEQVLGTILDPDHHFPNQRPFTYNYD